LTELGNASAAVLKAHARTDLLFAQARAEQLVSGGVPTLPNGQPAW
jgi:hypothetical protein